MRKEPTGLVCPMETSKVGLSKELDKIGGYAKKDKTRLYQDVVSIMFRPCGDSVLRV